MGRRRRGSRASRLWCFLVAGSITTAFGYVAPWVHGVNASGDEIPLPVCEASPVSAGTNAPALIRQRESGPGRDAAVSEESFQAADFAGFSSSSAGLVEEPGKSEAGGVKVNLAGRFRTSLVLERTPDGSTVQRCISNLPGAASGDR